MIYLLVVFGTFASLLIVVFVGRVWINYKARVKTCV